MYQTLIEKIEAHEKYGPALRDAVEKQTPLVLHVHAHEPAGSWCVAVLAERPMLMDLVSGGGGATSELVHIAGFAPNQGEGEARAKEFAGALQAHYGLGDPPRIDVELPPEAPQASAQAAPAAPPAHGQPGGPAYDPAMVQPMREEVTRLGVEELRTPAEVEAAFQRPGTTLVFVNSVCGCAAGGARPGLALALQMGAKKPDHCVTLFAGMEREAVAHARERFKPYQPSSPQFALLKDGELVQMWQRHDIEGREPQAIAQALSEGFSSHC